MAQRMEIELTSKRPEGGFTWRAAGARQPRGSVAGEVVPPDVKVGDVLRAEVESGIEGIEIVSLQPVRGEERPRAATIEVLGPPRRDAAVSVSLTGGGRRRDRNERRRPAAARGGEGNGRGREPRGRERRPPRGGRAEERRVRGALPVVTTHRNAALAALGPEELPVAEELLRGGLPAVRAAIEEQEAEAARRGRPPVAREALLAAAERLLPTVNLAAWKDRAAAAQAAGRELRLRDLRAVVAASRTLVLDEEGRTMAKALQETLDQRIKTQREQWLQRVTKALDEGRVADALAASGQFSDPTMRLPADLAVRLAQAAGTALRADLDPAEWAALLEAVVGSPVRRTVRPEGIPEDDRARGAALRAAGLVPDLARQLGLRVPPPPPRRSLSERPGARRPGGAARAGGS